MQRHVLHLFQWPLCNTLRVGECSRAHSLRPSSISRFASSSVTSRHEPIPPPSDVTPKEDAPSSPWPLPSKELHAYARVLRDLVRQQPMLTLEYITSIPHKHPHLLSTNALNILINACIRQSSFHKADRLLKMIDTYGLKPNLKTWRLRVRLHVARGDFARAFHTAQRAPESDDESGPMLPSHRMHYAVWMELLGQPHQTPQHQHWRDKWRPEARPDPEGEPPPNERFTTTFDPQIMPFSLPNVPLPYIRQIIRFLLQSFPPRRDLATHLTYKVLQSLPRKNLSPSDQSLGISLVNEHLHTDQPAFKGHSFPALDKPSLETHARHYALFKSFLKVRPEIRPNEETLVLLLGSLRRSHMRGQKALDLLRVFNRTWGKKGLITLRTRTIMLRYAIQGDKRHEAPIARLVKEQDNELAKGLVEGAAVGSGVERNAYFRVVALAKRKGIIGVSSSAQNTKQPDG